ncbi:metallophosphoesterase [Tateyamaria omphalii]|uniref:metallophosphoesterase n=1 Tax=Tateyamaria omphalii TaxID=299262 RepID=UPI001C990D8B|nr:metallophosphoesterase [Tateyamaria omphalii]MBY5934003.1 metallophosphoesterase [Tateyamaria omphalii]
MLYTLLWGLAALLLALVIYAWWIEPAWRLRVVTWRISDPAWAGREPLRIVVISDLHAGAPHIPLSRVSRIVARANALKPDLAVHLGDYQAAHPFTLGRMTKGDIIARLAGFTAPLGSYAVLGNHDWWQDTKAAKARTTPEAAQALRDHGIPLLDNSAIRLRDGKDAFWLIGLGDQRPLDEGPEGEGFDDLDAALNEVTDDAPCILLAHEPDIWPDVPDRVFLTLSGHTHGGQIQIGQWSPMIAASSNEDFNWGHYTSDGQHLVLSGGIGCSVAPVRFNVVPEITVIEVSGG